MYRQKRGDVHLTHPSPTGRWADSEPSNSSPASSSDSEYEPQLRPPDVVEGQRILQKPRKSTSKIESPGFVVEELSDFEDDNVGRQPGVVRPYEIEEHEDPESAPEQKGSTGVLSLNVNSNSDSNSDSEVDEAEYHELLRRRREATRRRKMRSGSSGKRTISAVVGSDTDLDDLGPLPFSEVGSSARRLRRRVGDRHSLKFEDPPPPRDIKELDEPTSSDDEDLASEALARELPFFGIESVEIDIEDDGSGPEYTGRFYSLYPSLDAEFVRRGRTETTKSTLSHDESFADHRGLKEKPNISTPAQDNTDDSETSDLESIMSETPSIASSQSSVATSIDLGAIHELKTLLLMNESLGPLYEVAMSKVGPDKFQRNFRRLLVRYGRALSAEATAPLQSKAATFIRHAALRVSIQIKDAIEDKSITQPEKEKLSAKALGDYLEKLQDVDDSSDEEYDDLDHDAEEPLIQALDSVKHFMISSKAFGDLCQSLRAWLGVEASHDKADMEDIAAQAIEPEAISPVDNTAGEPFQQTQRQGRTEDFTVSKNNSVGEHLPDVNDFDQLAANRVKENQQKEAASSFSVVRIALNRFRSTLTGLWQPRPPADEVRISWTCRCGDTLRIQVPEAHQTAAVAFAKQAAGPNANTITSQSSTGTTRITSQTIAPTASNTSPQTPNLTPSSSNISTTTDPTTDSSSTTSTFNSTSSRPSSPNTTLSDTEAPQPSPFLPASTKKYLLLCVNTSGLGSIPLRKLANVDITDISSSFSSEELFSRLRTAYHTLRPRRNPFLIPKAMHYIHFQLLFLQKSGECIGSYQVDSIPSIKEVLNQEYAFSPCPPRIGKLPLPPDIFMHAFLDPGDHLGGMAVDVLPKKLWCRLGWDERQNGRWDVPPAGWGFYIVEGVDWGLVSVCAGAALVGVTVLTVVWSVVVGDVQGGTGLGQYCLAVLTLGVSVWLMRDRGVEGIGKY